MSGVLIVSGTDTGIGKTVLSAMLTLALDGFYWKPVQSGLDGETDSEAVKRMSGLAKTRIFPEAYRLNLPASPNISAEADGLSIDPARLSLPEAGRPLIVEGAGGLLVPLTRTRLFIDQFKVWKAPVVLCARTKLGTINHTLLSIEALKHRGIPLLGVAFIGDEAFDSERTIVEFSGAKHLGRLPELDDITPDKLRAAFNIYFKRDVFLKALSPAHAP